MVDPPSPRARFAFRHHALGVALIAALACVGCGQGDAVPAEPHRPEPAAGSVASALRDILPKGASGTLVAARDGRIVTCRGLGLGLADRERRVAATCDTVYDVMSMTKQFTAAAVLKLEMLGELKVTDPIGRYLGKVPADKREITLHQLLTHTAGLAGAIGGDYERLTRRGMLAAGLASKLRSRPGTEYHYSNLGYSILAAVIEKVSGIGYEEFLAKHLFAPAGMTQTGYVLPDWKHRQVAVEYDARGMPQGRPFDHPWADDGPYWNLRGNGGILSTARDMFRWHRALEGDAVLDEPSKEQLFKAHVREGPGSDTHYGYGWVIAEMGERGAVAWHNGGNGWSYGEVTRVLNEDAFVFWVTNRFRDRRAGWNLSRLGPELTRGVVAALRTGS